MSISALSSTQPTYPIAQTAGASSASASSAAQPPTGVPDSPNDGDGDDATTVASSPTAQSSNSVQVALQALTVGG